MSDRAVYLRAAESLRRNPGQWAAYESRGHCIVLAGPGSGKTKTLSTKIARMLAEDIEEPRGVACITYNNECARELEGRLDALGVEPGGRVFIGTVHSFSLTQIVLPYAKVAGLGLPDEFSVATRAERAAALGLAVRRTIENPGNPQDWDLRMGTYRRSILNRGSSEWRERDPELARLVEAYEEALRSMGRVDFDDMPLLAVRALRDNPWLQRALLAKYPALVVDEYQDLGRALHRMVMGLCFSAGMRLFAVGDTDQSIYGFTGAHPELLQQLSEREDVETVHLRLNYRSGSRIVTASRYALGEERDYEAAEGASEGAVFFHALRGTYEQQARHLVETLLPQAMARKPGLQYGDIAVLYPAAWIGDAVVSAAQAYGVPTLRTDGSALYPRSSRLMQWLELCAQWCCGGWRSGVPRFARLVGDGRRLFAEVLRTEDDIVTFHRRLMAALWARRNADMSLHQWLVDVRRESIEPLLARCGTLGEEGETLAAFVERTSIPGDCSEMVLGRFAGHGAGHNSVSLSTLHSAKGREFSVVFMFGMDDGRLPRAGSSGRQLAEFRRLFYVGFTRAKAKVHLVFTVHRASPFVSEVQQRLEAGG